MKNFFLFIKYSPFVFPSLLIILISLWIFSHSPLSEAKEKPDPQFYPSEFIQISLQEKTDSFYYQQQVTNEEIIPFETVYESDPELEKGQEIVSIEGIEGKKIQTFSIDFYEDAEVNRTLITEEIISPQNKIIKQGIKVVIRELTTPEGIFYYHQKLTVYATPYTASSAGGNGYTATGTKAQFGSVAVDPNIIPLGTKMYIPGYGFGLAEDTGGAINGNMIDLFYEGNHGWWNSKYVEIYLLAP